MKPLKSVPEEKKALIRMILTLSGIVFGALGLTILLMPSGISSFIGSDDYTIAYIFGAALLMVGVSDIAIARLLFKQTINELEDFKNKES